MKSIFDKETQREIIDRANSLTTESNPRWGSMTVTQMVRHCALCDEYYFGNIQVKRAFLGRIIGRMAINQILKDETTTFRKNSQAPLQFRVTENIEDLEAERKRWSDLIERYSDYPDKNFEHWFFGKLSKEHLGQLVYKHSDYHLKQFSC